ncbi:NACHT domain-containing protein [Calothrix sp. NIES-2098]|uniref:NACHT domain-containing protein n=1 Tax=Calothrix sp. NIES-2098 TaxID=1954171 RepID=UPI0030D733E6
MEIFGNGKSRVQVTQALNISDSNLSSCLTGIYKKFSINGSGPVKETRLREYLEKRYSHQKLSGSSTAEVAEDDIDALVQEIREQVKPSIKEKCGTMRVLDMPQPIELTGERGIYTNVNILEKITGRRRLDISELLHNSDPDDFERFGLNRIKEERVSGLEAVQRHHKLMVLGKPGAGKSTFLKYLAMQYIEGEYLTNRVPLFIALKDFAEAPKQPDLLEYIAQKLTVCGVQNASVKADKLLRQGKLLVLLDGLDEVREEDTKHVLLQIRDISDQFHTNQFVITCRIAAKEYTFEKFTEVEVADFNKDQIAIFAQNWFRLTDPVKGESFIQKLNENIPIQELATNPLLLTLLCLVFGENGSFPANRSELYKEGLDVLLKKWDAKRNIERDQVYKSLSLYRKEDLLSQIALTTFEQKDYFFKQKTVEAYIADFIRNLRDARTDPKELELDSEVVLKSIEAQHGLLVERAKGIYSFSHLTFHEYFAAREIVANSIWEKLLEYITDKRWREVFLLTVGMMRKADELVLSMKRKIDDIVANDKKIQEFLVYINEKATLANSLANTTIIRNFYFDVLIRLNLYGITIDYPSCIETFFTVKNLSSFQLKKLLGDIGNNCLLDFYLIRIFNLSNITISSNESIDKLLLQKKLKRFNPYFVKLFDGLINFTSDNDLIFEINKLHNELPYPGEEIKFQLWANSNINDWRETLISTMVKYRNIKCNWEFSTIQSYLLIIYNDANELLVDCMRNAYVSLEVREQIEKSLLLPVTKI